MTKTEVYRFRTVLTARVAELERVNRHRDAITVERSADEMEKIQAASQRPLAVCNLDREFNQLRDARAALRRIQVGSFGTCQKCDPPEAACRSAVGNILYTVSGSRRPQY
jgi:RNA polymerase-binding transcription factor DksA